MAVPHEPSEPNEPNERATEARPGETTPRIKVLSVVGAGRSGTTVLASILSEVPGCASAGEIRWLWQRGIIERRPCGCGKAPEDCPVWAPVVERSLDVPGPDGRPLTAEQIVTAQRELQNPRNRRRVLRSAARPDTDWAALRVVRSVMDEALHAFAESSHAQVVVDTSKRPHDAAVIAALPDVDHYVLHVVRDPRAVVHSWRRAKTFSVDGETRTMGTRRLPSTVRRWIASALGTELLRRYVPRDRWLELRYEDFCDSPREAFARILALLGEEGASPFASDTTVRLHPNHIVAGNPSRFTVGEVSIRADEEWRTAMSKRDQRLVVAATWPLLRKYGYAARQ